MTAPLKDVPPPPRRGKLPRGPLLAGAFIVASLLLARQHYCAKSRPVVGKAPRSLPASRPASSSALGERRVKVAGGASLLVKAPLGQLARVTYVAMKAFEAFPAEARHGDALARCASGLAEAGVGRYSLEVGARRIVSGGTAARPWRVALRLPGLDKGELVLRLESAAVAWDDGSGKATGCETPSRAVVVVHRALTRAPKPDPSSLRCLEASAARARIDALEGAEGVIVDSKGAMHRSRGFGRLEIAP